MKKEDFANYIYRTTGRVLDQEFSIEAGTRSPFSDGGGMMSASRVGGYIVHLHTDKSNRMLLINDTQPEQDALDKIVEFLKKT